MSDTESIAREILRLDADRDSAEPQGDFFDYMVVLRNTAPILAAAYLDLRAQLAAVTAQRDELREATSVWYGPDCEEPVDDFSCGHCDACKMNARVEKALEAAECAEVVGEVENIRRLDVLNEETDR